MFYFKLELGLKYSKIICKFQTLNYTNKVQTAFNSRKHFQKTKKKYCSYFIKVFTKYNHKKLTTKSKRKNSLRYEVNVKQFFFLNFKIELQNLNLYS